MHASPRSHTSCLALTVLFGVLSLGASEPLAGQQAADVPHTVAPSLMNPPPARATPTTVPMGPRLTPLVESIRPATATADMQPNTTFTISTVGLLLIIIIVILLAR